MTSKEIEILAHNNRPMPKFSSFVDVWLYQAFANLYSRLKMNKVIREQAKTEKKQILSTFEQIKSEREQCITVYRERQDNIRRAGTLLSDIEKAADVKTIALKACECLGLMTGDREFLKRQLGKFEVEK